MKVMGGGGCEGEGMVCEGDEMVFEGEGRV